MLRSFGFNFKEKYVVDSIKPMGNKLLFSILSNRWALWGKCIIRQVYTRRLQERWRMCESSCRWIHVWVSKRRVRKALLRDDHAQFPWTVLCHLQRPEAEVPLHRVLHVSTFLVYFFIQIHLNRVHFSDNKLKNNNPFPLKEHTHIQSVTSRCNSNWLPDFFFIPRSINSWY